MKPHVPFLVLLALPLTTGCVSFDGSQLGSLNMQRCGLRGAGDLSVTVMLDSTEVADVPRLQERVLAFLETVEQFAATGDLAALTRMEFTDRLLAKVSPEYAPWVRGALGTAMASLDAHAIIGEKNKRRILAYVNGSRRAVAAYNVEDRVGRRAKVAPLPVSGVPPWPAG